MKIHDDFASQKKIRNKVRVIVKWCVHVFIYCVISNFLIKLDIKHNPSTILTIKLHTLKLTSFEFYYFIL